MFQLKWRGKFLSIISIVRSSTSPTFTRQISIEYENGSGWALPLIFYKVTFGALLNLLTTTLQSIALKNASM